MTYQHQFIDKDDYLLCNSQGEILDSDCFLKWAKQVMTVASELGHTKILFDNRSLNLNLASLDVVTFAKELEEMGAALLGLRMAVASSSDNYETSRLVETSLTNRSASYKSFSELSEAKEWLFL